MAGTEKTLPTHAELAQDLRTLREKGLLRIRDLDLVALHQVSAAAGESDSPGPRDVERLLRRVADRLGDDDVGKATKILFGLVQGTIGHRPTDLRARAAEVFGISAETFRKDRERLIVSRLADELLTSVGEPPTAPPDPPLEVAGSRSAESVAGTAPPAGLPAFVAGLPPDPETFTGREAELLATCAAFPTDRGAIGTGTMTCAVHGIAGAGKTALAVRAARQLAQRFPDGVIFLGLHGHSPDLPPEDPADVLDRLLRRLKVAAELIPAGVDERSALLSDTLAVRRLLLVLDDARDAGQLQPLLPAAPGCGVIVTSRNRLAGLDEATHVVVGSLPRPDAVRLFATVAGIPVVPDGDVAEALDTVAERCGDLPLALRIAAGRHRVEPAETLHELVHRLRHEHDRLAELTDDSRSVAAAFFVSYEALPTSARRAFAQLSIHPGNALSTDAATALLGGRQQGAHGSLDTLVDRHLVEREVGRRLRLHDLMAAFARQQLVDMLTRDEQTEAFRRMAEHYLLTAARADSVLTPHRHQIDLEVSEGLPVPEIHDYDAAWTWMVAEEETLVAVCEAAAGRELDDVCWRLAYTLRGWFFIGKRWDAWRRSHEAAVVAARRLGDRKAEAITLNSLGVLALERGRQRIAADRYRAALALFREIGDDFGEHNSIANLAWVAFADGEYETFVRQMRTAFEFYDRSGEVRNAAITLRGMALGEIALGRPRDAVEHLESALTEFRELGGPLLDIAIALNNLGEAYAVSGAHAEARRSHQDAVHAAKRAGTVFEAARAHVRLGDLSAAEGDRDRGRAHWRQALAIYDELGAPQVEELRERLAAPRTTPGGR